MLLYLGGSTRLDISYDVHQCARYLYKPRRSYETVIKQIERYLKGTKTKDHIMKPDKSKFQLDVYADADFAGLFTSEDKDDPISVKSRTGLLITFRDVTIF